MRAEENVFLRRAACLPALFGVLAFWCGILIAEQRYGAEFDWRYMTVSNLLSPVHNPTGHLWAKGGIGLSGLCWLCWTVAISRGWGQRITGDNPRGIWPLGCGSVCMLCSGVLPLRLPGLPKGHEVLTVLAFVGLCLGVVCLAFQTVKRGFRLRADGPTRRRRLYGAALAGVVVLPIVLAGVAQAYVYYVLPELHWVGLSWRARGVPMYLSFAFWEWVTCAVLSIHLAILSLGA